jgi:hypothetical protein
MVMLESRRRFLLASFLSSIHSSTHGGQELDGEVFVAEYFGRSSRGGQRWKLPLDADGHFVVGTMTVRLL